MLLFFVSRWNQAIFGRHFSTCCSTKPFSSILDLGPLTSKICSPKFAQNRLDVGFVWQIDRICLGLPGRFRGWPIQWTMQNVVWPTLVAMATKFGLGAEIESPTGLSNHLLCICCRYDTNMSKKAECSSCSCRREWFEPVCGADGLTYFSPCYAGCQNSLGDSVSYLCIVV